MRGYVPGYPAYAPRDLDEALELLGAQPGEWLPLAGGTDLMVYLEAGMLPPCRLLSIRHLPELRRIDVDARSVSLGALTTYTQVRRHPLLQQELPMLCAAARCTGALAIQNRGTLGGNIINGSPAADTPPALLAYGAELELISRTGVRRLPYDSFHTGYKTMERRPDELLRAIRVQRPAPGTIHYYRKVGTRAAQAIAKVCIAAAVQLQAGQIEQCQIAMGAVAPIPLRLQRTEELLCGQRPDAALAEAARACAMREVSPIDDIRSTRDYRRTVAGNLVVDLVEQLNGQQ